MRVVVTGGAGFIGSHLTDAVLARGGRVTVVDDLSSGRAERLDQRVELVTATVTDGGRMRELMLDREPAVIFHLAAQIDVRRSVADPVADAEANVLGTINVLESARAVGAKVVFASTGGAIYGVTAPIPSPEQVAPEPEAPYGTAKFCAEQYLGLYNRLHGARHCALRLGNVYGPRQDTTGEAGVVAIFCGLAVRGQPPTIFGDGAQTRDYVYVGDVVKAFLLAASSEQTGTWNIGTGSETSVLRLAELVGEAAGRPFEPRFAPARPGELVRSALDGSAAAQVLGWKPETSLEDGIRATYAWAAAAS
jgi:UDP-glucose 4-epimerase